MNAVISDWPSGSANTGWPSEPSGMLMPGRVEGWPAGTQRAASPAERLLSQAVAWWDASSYRDGDRFLRNRGTGGELLNLRLGSSIAANSNDPLYLPVADEGYVYLTGVAGNSLSVTALATATNFIAYPLDRSVATTTGAVTGGATFTFSTTGSWRLIELLDASNVVVDTIDCDVITTGSVTSFASGIVNQTVTINRSTGGRKSVAVPSRSKGGAPLFSFASDDYMEIPVENRWQHGLLNFDAGQSFTILAVLRTWATPTNGGYYVGKRGPTTGPGWRLASNGTALAASGLLISASISQIPVSPSFAAGGVRTLTFVVDRASNTASTAVDGSAGAAASTSAVGSLANTGALSVGRYADLASNYQDFEFYGAVIFRRALTADEIRTVSNHFTGRIA